MKGYANKLLFVDLTTGEIVSEDWSDSDKEAYLGGYGIGAKILLERMPANADPFGEESILGFCSGSLNATKTLMAGRYTVVHKSPVTGGYNDANSGGAFGPEMKKAGFDAIFVKGIAKEPVYLYVCDGKAEIRPAGDLWGKDCKETWEILKEKTGNRNVRVACIGEAGEKLSYVACIINDGHRAAGRGGCGAVMGSKNLKAVACVGTGKMEIAKEAEFKAANAVVAQNMRDPNGYSAFLGPMIIDHSTHGTAGTTVYSSLSGDSPIKNWGGSVPADFGGEEHVKSALHPDAFDPKYNKGPFACSQCIMHCGAKYEINDGKWPIGETERPEYETLVTFGPLCLVKDVNAAFKANEVCNRTGLDTISAGSTIAWVMECYENGVLTKEDLDGIEANFGNADAMIALLEKMADGSGCGKVLKLGSYHASKVWGKGEEYLVVSQGMEPAMHDPRKVRASGYAAIYKFDPTPGRHVKGGVHGSYDEDEKVLAANADRSVPVALQAMDNLAKLAYQEIMNVTGICMFSNYILPANWVNEQISNVTGMDFTYEKSFNTGLRLYFMRQAFNIREGITREKMWISPRLAGHPALETGLNAGTDLIDAIEHYGDVFYRSMGCDIRTGIPYPETLNRIGHLDLALKIAENYGV